MLMMLMVAMMSTMMTLTTTITMMIVIARQPPVSSTPTLVSFSSNSLNLAWAVSKLRCSAELAASASARNVEWQARQRGRVSAAFQ